MPAVVVGGTLNALGVVRSLSRGGVPVILLETTQRCPAAWSRHCTFVRVPSLEGDALIGALLHLASELRCRPVLMLTSDESVLAISAASELITPLYCVDLPAPRMIAALADKASFHELALREGFAVPRSLSIAAASDLDRIEELASPVIIKPADKRLVLAGAIERAVRAETSAQARAAAARMLARAPALIVQEWIEGPDTEIYFTLFCCDRETNFVGVFPGRKLVCSPPTIGSTAVCIAAPELAGELIRQTRQFIDRVGYRGLGGLEFKRDVRTGRLLIVEPTAGRTDWQEEIATLCGVNLPLLAYQTALGSDTSSPSGMAYERFAWRASREFPVPRDFLGSRTRVVDGYFRWADPLPALYYYAYERLLMRIRKRIRRLIRRTSKLAAGAH